MCKHDSMFFSVFKNFFWNIFYQVCEKHVGLPVTKQFVPKNKNQRKDNNKPSTFEQEERKEGLPTWIIRHLPYVDNLYTSVLQ